MTNTSTLIRQAIERLPANDPRRQAALEQFEGRRAAVAVEPVGEPDGTVEAISVTLALRTVSEANAGLAHGLSKKLGRKKLQRCTVANVLGKMRSVMPAGPWRVTLTRVGRRVLDDDNLASAMKAVRDGVAQALGKDDGDRQAFEWCYGQECGANGYYVRISVEKRPAAEPT